MKTHKISQLKALLFGVLMSALIVGGLAGCEGSSSGGDDDDTNTNTNTEPLLESSQTLPQTDGAAVALADIDGDGDLDAVVTGDWGSEGTYPTKVWLNDGEGSFDDSGQSKIAANDLALADFNGDGHVDAALHHTAFDKNSPFTSPSEFRLLVNDGAGNLVDSGQVYGNSTNAYGAVAAADLDGDGNVDLFGGLNGHPDLVFTNESGLVNSQQSLDSGSDAWNATEDVALGDIDGDGVVEAVVAYEGFASGEEPCLWVWENDGSGDFTKTDQKLVHVDEPERQMRAVALGDVDDDGDLDLVTTYQDGASGRVWINDGNGVFSDTGQALDNPDESMAPVFADMDGDGDLDLVIGTTDNVQLWVNDGQGGFVLAETAQVLGEDIAVGDLNGDGKADVFVQASSHSEVLLNSGE